MARDALLVADEAGSILAAHAEPSRQSVSHEADAGQLPHSDRQQPSQPRRELPVTESWRRHHLLDRYRRWVRQFELSRQPSRWPAWLPT